MVSTKNTIRSRLILVCSNLNFGIMQIMQVNTSMWYRDKKINFWKGKQTALSVIGCVNIGWPIVRIRPSNNIANVIFIAFTSNTKIYRSLHNSCVSEKNEAWNESNATTTTKTTTQLMKSQAWTWEKKREKKAYRRVLTVD